jgi:hypothetical protein
LVLLFHQHVLLPLWLLLLVAAVVAVVMTVVVEVLAIHVD